MSNEELRMSTSARAPFVTLHSTSVIRHSIFSSRWTPLPSPPYLRGRIPMLRNLLSLAVLLAALPTFGGGIVVYPQTVSVRVGEVAVLHAENQPGGLSSGYPYNAEFSSDNASVAEIHGFASGSGYLA